jgi:hypothetical protein
MVRIHASQPIQDQGLVHFSENRLKLPLGLSVDREVHPAKVCDFGSQGCRFEPCRVQVIDIKLLKGLRELK